MLENINNIFGFESYHNPHLGISKLLKEFTLKFLSSVRVVTKPSAVKEQRKPLSRIIVSILGDMNSLLAVLDWDAGFSGLRVDFYSKGCSV